MCIGKNSNFSFHCLCAHPIDLSKGLNSFNHCAIFYKISHFWHATRIVGEKYPDFTRSISCSKRLLMLINNNKEKLYLLNIVLHKATIAEQSPQ